MPTRLEMVIPAATETARVATDYFNQALGTRIEPPRIKLVKGTTHYDMLGNVCLGIPERGWVSKFEIEFDVPHETFHHFQKKLGLLGSFSKNREARIYLQAGANFSESAFVTRNTKKKRKGHILQILSGELESLDVVKRVSLLGLKDLKISEIDAERALAALLFVDNNFKVEDTLKDFTTKYKDILPRLRPPALSDAMKRLRRELRR